MTAPAGAALHAATFGIDDRTSNAGLERACSSGVQIGSQAQSVSWTLQAWYLSARCAAAAGGMNAMHPAERGRHLSAAAAGLVAQT
jgi:hypothetical protein